MAKKLRTMNFIIKKLSFQGKKEDRRKEGHPVLRNTLMML